MNVIDASHPGKEQLQAFALGRLDEAASLAIEEHLAGCAACLSAVEASPGDPFVRLVQAARVPKASDSTQDAYPAPQRASTEPPAALADHPRYRVVRYVGSGGMGTVFAAEDLLMNRAVALKIVNPRLVDRPAAVERFGREVRAAAKLIHPNVVTALDAGQVGDVHFLIMEYVDGKGLDQLLAEKGRLPVAQACEYVRQAAIGLQHAHECGMVHRDVKPQNLIVTSQGQVKILDFGLARLALEAGTGAVSPRHGGEATALTDAGAIMGTPDYLAPEQARDPHAADVRADVYSLGCTLYHLLAGRPPFPGGTPGEKMKAHAEQAPEPLDKRGLGVSPELSAIVLKMLAKDPACRPQTPAQVAQVLQQILTASSSKPPRWKTVLWVLVCMAIPAVALVVASFKSEPARESFIPVGVIFVVVFLGWALLLILTWLKSRYFPTPPVIRMLELRRTKEQIWGVIADFDSYLSWRGELLNVHRKEQPSFGAEEGVPKWWREVYKDGHSREFFTLALEINEPSHLRLHFVGIPAMFTWDLDLAPTESGTRVIITVKPSWSPFAVFAWSLRKQTRDAESYLQSLAARFGEPADVRQG
jgi:serine/threonine protein kinase